MPAHIFTRVGAWRESVALNEASVAASKGDTRYTLPIPARLTLEHSR